MTFKNEAQLKKFLAEKCNKAIHEAERKVYEELAGNLNQFYYEFKPEEYIRTGALFNSLESTGVIQTRNGSNAEVWFNTPHYRHGFVPLQSGDYGYSDKSDKKILDIVMTGDRPHGDYEEGTAIWVESMERLGGKHGIKMLLQQELKRQGL